MDDYKPVYYKDDAATGAFTKPKTLFGMTYPVWYFIVAIVAFVAFVLAVS